MARKKTASADGVAKGAVRDPSEFTEQAGLKLMVRCVTADGQVFHIAQTVLTRESSLWKDLPDGRLECVGTGPPPDLYGLVPWGLD